MKKQKKPILLVLSLAILLGIVAFIGKSADTEGQPGQPPAGAAPPEDSKDNVADQVGKQLKDDKSTSSSKTAAPGKAASRMGGPQGKFPGPQGPSLMKPAESSFKPKPNDSSTSTQWYTPESARSGK